MATLDDHRSPETNDPLPIVDRDEATLFEGQQLDQPRFHDLYRRTPEGFRAELIEGVVYVMSSPVSPKHGRPSASMNGLLYVYSIDTPGTILQSDTTAKLSPSSEVQPDCALLIDPSHGGQTREDEDGYTTGCPELVVEVSLSSLQLDLNAKRREYEKAGAREYVVLDGQHRKIFWFASRNGRFEPLAMGADGLYRSEVFPGLWLDPDALLSNDQLAVIAALRRGLESPAHADFVDRLRANRANRP